MECGKFRGMKVIRVGFKEKRDTWKNGRGSYGVVCELQNKS